MTVVGAGYATDAGYTVTGTAANGKITLSIPLAKLGLSAGDKIINVAADARAIRAASGPGPGLPKPRVEFSFWAEVALFSASAHVFDRM